MASSSMRPIDCTCCLMTLQSSNLDYTDSTTLQDLPIPVSLATLSSAASSSSENRFSACGVCCPGIVTEKPNQDRAFLHQVSFESKSLLLFGVFDGHGSLGHVAADLCLQSVLGFFVEANLKSEGILEKALLETMGKLQELVLTVSLLQKEEIEYLEKKRETVGNSEEQKKWEFGTTAYICCLDTDARELYLANVGDSTCLIFSKSSGTLNDWTFAQPLSEHEFHDTLVAGRTREDLKKDSELQIPIVRLNMTRALGHIQLRYSGLSSEPDVTSRRINPRKDCVVICGSDGLFNYVREDTICTILCSNSIESEFSDISHRIAKVLLQSALESSKSRRGDNISFVVVYIPKL